MHPLSRSSPHAPLLQGVEVLLDPVSLLDEFRLREGALHQLGVLLSLVALQMADLLHHTDVLLYGRLVRPLLQVQLGLRGGAHSILDWQMDLNRISFHSQGVDCVPTSIGSAYEDHPTDLQLDHLRLDGHPQGPLLGVSCRQPGKRLLRVVRVLFMTSAHTVNRVRVAMYLLNNRIDYHSETDEPP